MGHPSNLAAALKPTTATAVTAARPSAAGAGVDITSWYQGAFAPRHVNVVVQADGTDRTVADPTSGTAGVEVWIYKPDRAGTLRWFLVAYLNAGADVVAATPGGYIEMIALPPGGQRVHVAGMPSGGAPTFYVEPVELYI